MMAVPPPILVILGPTASGKSELALEVARRTNDASPAAGHATARTEILSVDSMQVYRGMDIGTAKPSAAERAAVAHRGIDLVEPDATFTVARFVGLADAAIADAGQRGAPLIAAGGTPLYFKALFEGIFGGPGADAEIRRRLRQLPNEELHRRLHHADPAAAQRIHLNDTRRLIRALEVHELTGQPISSFQTDWSSPTARHPAVWIGLDWDRDALNRRINARVKSMIAAGWLDETRALLDRFAELSQTAAEATGYRELIDHLRGRITLDDAIEHIKISTRQLARRQMKWFRRFTGVTWLPGDSPLEQRVSEVLRLWRV
jgi:tRNA dimethylallyltransferase